MRSNNSIGLCHRCEHRARHLEDERWRPRWECGNVGRAVWSCYMYAPVKPFALAPNAGDDRPALGPWMFSARCHVEEWPGEAVERVSHVGGVFARWWEFRGVGGGEDLPCGVPPARLIGRRRK